MFQRSKLTKHAPRRFESDICRADMVNVIRDRHIGSASGVDPAHLAAKLREAFTANLDMEFEISVPTPDERQEAKLLGMRYLDPDFLRRR